MKSYFRPIVQTDVSHPPQAKRLAGGWCWFTHVEVLRRGQHSVQIPAQELPADILERLTSARADICGLQLTSPRLMGILNVTPDSFSDGGEFVAPDTAVARAKEMVTDGADLVDIGGESTRPGAAFVPDREEQARTAPVIHALCKEISVPISIDTRKATVAEAAIQAGAQLVNDVSGCRFDDAMAPLVAQLEAPICVMHAQGDPETMQDNPEYEDVVLDVYDALETQVDGLVSLGVSRHNIVVDPGIGFGKTLAHNLALLARISLFHSLGCPVLLGASRKRFIGTIGKAPLAQDRMPGSIAVALEGVAQGVQFVRIHDVAETRQAIDLWRAVTTGEFDDA